MDCPSCEHANPDDARFCNGCGASLARACGACGRENPPGARFCNHCGASLTEADGDAPASRDTGVPERDPREFTPQHLAQRILTSRSSLEGERKHVTVVFMDVVGFTSLAEPTDPERVREIINRCIETILEQVHEYEGTVNQFTGDGVMALFGAPIALEDAPRRAVSAALAVHRALEPLRREVRQSLGTDFQMRVGIHSGTVVVGSIGNDLRMEYTAVGDTTNLASRLEQLAAPGSVLVSDAMRRQIEPFFELRDLGDVAVKGRVEPVRVYEVVSERAARARFEGAIRAGLTGFVGRERELETLHAAYEEARAGHGQIAFLVGDAGIGKTRLLYEFRRRLRERDPESFYWMEGRCASFGRNTAFGPIADGIRRAYRIDERDDDDSAIAKVLKTEAAFSEDLRWTIPSMRSLLSLPVGDEPEARAFAALEASDRRAEVQRALEARLMRASSQRPMIFVIEDLHWIDAASEQMLRALSESIPAGRILLLLTHRPGYQQPLGDRSYHLRIGLQALPQDQSLEMARALVGTENFHDDLHRLISDKAEGNPFFVEELTRSLLEAGAIRVAGDRAELASGVAELAIPDRIQDVVAARIDRLEEDLKRAIQIASVIGREFLLRLLDRVNDVDRAPGRVVDELRALELVYQKATYPEAVFMFKHALTHDVAYESVLHERRKELHRAVGEAIEELYPERLAEHYEALAHHFNRGESWGEALRFHDLAAAKATESYANQSAAEHLREAIALAERLADSVPRAKRAELAERLGYACSVLSDFAGARDAYARAARESDDPVRLCRNLASAAHWALWAHDYDGAEALRRESEVAAKRVGTPVERARVLLNANYNTVVLRGTKTYNDEAAAVLLRDSESDPQLCAMTYTIVGQANEWLGDYRTAISRQDRAIAIAQEHRLPSMSVLARWFGAKAACCVGDYRRALGDLHAANDLADRIGDRAWKARLLNTLGWALAETGRDDLALEFNRQSTELGEEMVKLELVAGAPEIYGNAAINLACNWIARGELGAAADQLGAVRADLEASDDPWMRWRYQMHFWDATARYELARGEPEHALGWLAKEVSAARDYRARKLEARALELRGRALVTLDQRDEAREALLQAREIAVAIEYPPVLWRSESLLGAIAQREGSRRDADAHFARAAGRLGDLALPDLDDAARAGLERLAEAVRSDPLGAYR